MDYLKGAAWVGFVRECMDDLRAGQRLFGRAASIIVIRNRWSFIGSLPYPRGRQCIANDN